MTNPNNGATLEDCHSNFFALTDLCGIKWRRLVSDGLMGSGHAPTGPLEDPVLSSFARCLAADILCVWRKSPNTKLNQQQAGGGGGGQQQQSNDPFHPAAPSAQTPPHFMHHHPQTPGGGSTTPGSQSNQMQSHHIPSHLSHMGMNMGPQHQNVPPYPQNHSHHPVSHGLPNSSMHTPQQIHKNNPTLNGPKELWIFWYGEEPDLSLLVSSQLLRSDQGSWESGLSYECRTLLFKALHNLIERCLLARDFVRIDKWFLQPCDENQVLRSFPMQLSFSFAFFVHGDSTVCMSVDVRQHPAVRRINKHHLIASQSHPLPVILAPHGLAGTLTGGGCRVNEPGTNSKILEEWNHFYPVEVALKSPLYDTTMSQQHSSASPHPVHSSSSSSSSSSSAVPPNPSSTTTSTLSSIPPVLEVRVGGVLMRYPSCYVLCTELDEVPRLESSTLSSPPVTGNNNNNSNSNTCNVNFPNNTNSNNLNISNNNNAIAATTPRSRVTVSTPDSESAACANGPSPGKPQGGISVNSPQEVDNVEGLLPERVWQECILSSSKGNSEQTSYNNNSNNNKNNSTNNSNNNNNSSSATTTSSSSSSSTSGPGPGTPSNMINMGNNSDSLGQWDFTDPTKKMTCTCSRCKRVSSERVTSGVGSTKGGGSTKVKKSSYHKRNPQHLSCLESWGNMWDLIEDPSSSTTSADNNNNNPNNCSSNKGTESQSSNNNRLNIGSGMPSTPGGGNGPPSYRTALGSEGPGDAPGPSPAPSIAPSPLATPRSQQPASVPPQQEPPMPTLSPQPASDKPPAATPDNNVAPKSVSSLSNQVFSPIGNNNSSSGYDGAKPENTEQQTVGNSSNNSSSNSNNATNCNGSGKAASADGQFQSTTTSNINGVAHSNSCVNGTSQMTGLQAVKSFIKRPVLPSKDYENLLAEEDCGQPSEIIYDYSALQAWLNYPVKRMKTNDGNVKPTEYVWGLGMKERSDSSFSLGKRRNDPYEFNDEHHQAPAMSNDSLKRKEGCTGIKEEEKSPFFPTEMINGGKTGARNLFTSEGIQPSLRDLDQIFDNSDTSSDETIQAPTPPGSNKPAGSMDDSSGMPTLKCKPGLSSLRPEELSKMFPTPPSHEHNPISSPCGQPETPSGMDINDHCLRRPQDNFPGLGSPPVDDPMENRIDPASLFIRNSTSGGGSNTGVERSQHPRLHSHSHDWSFVYKPSSVYKMLGSSKYAPLPILPSQQLPPLSIPVSSATYVPTWQVNANQQAQQQQQQQQQQQNQQQSTQPPTPIANNNPGSVSSMHPHPYQQQQQQQGSLGMGSAMPNHMHIRPGLSPISPVPNVMRGPASDLGSPIWRHGPPSVHGVGRPPSLNHPSQSSGHQLYGGPEAHALVVNLSLSDSVMNLFRDHNFDSCTMCVCNASVKVVGNIRGSEVGLYIPDPSPDEDPVRCNCGFSASVNRRLAHRAGLFYEDEFEIATAASAPLALPQDEWYERRKPSFLLLDPKYPNVNALAADKAAVVASSVVDSVPPYLLEMLREQSLLLFDSTAASRFSGDVINHRFVERMYNYLDYLDGNRAALTALEHGRTVMLESRSTFPRMPEDTMPLKPNIHFMHKWQYLWGRGPQSSRDVMQVMRTLHPLLQDAVHTKAWDAQYTVSGPLTWRQFHRLAGRGTDDRCDPQPIPSILIGSEKDFVALSPLSIKFWEKLLLEPYAYPRDVAYIVVAPEADFILNKVRTFFRELSAVYETCQLGRHCPISKPCRDGILRVGKTAATRLASEPIDEWFTMLPDIPISYTLRLYAQVCRHYLVPTLASISLDQSLLDSSNSPSQVPRPSPQERPTPSPKMPPPDGVNSSQGPATPKNEYESEYTSKEVPLQENIDEDERDPPALVVYLVEPFGFGADNKDMHRMANLGLLRGFASMLNFLPENIRNNITLQVISLEDIMSLGGSINSSYDSRFKNDQLRSLSLTIYSQCRRLLVHQNTVKSLTGFGPAAGTELFLKTKDEKKKGSYKLYTPPYVLAPMKEKVSEGVEWLGGIQGHTVGGMVSNGGGLSVGPSFSPTSSVLYVAYCISEDHRWLLASATDDRGELLETTIISIYVPNRSRRRKASARKHGLQKLMDFILGIMSTGVLPWRLVVGRLGRVGHGELESWSSLLSRKSLLRASNQLKEACRQCNLQYPGDSPCVLSACLVSLEPDSCLRLMPDQFTPDERFGVGPGTSSTLSTPQDISCTHILVFPTSATTQSSQTAFQEQHINGPELGDDDLLFINVNEDMSDGIDGMQDLQLGDIFSSWEDNADAPGIPGSPRRDSASQPGSPGGIGASGRQSPFQSGGQSRSGGRGDGSDDLGTVLQQPLALGYFVSTAPAGQLPSWFWASCPQRSVEKDPGVFLKSALHLHSHSVLHNLDDLQPIQQQTSGKQHPLDSQFTTDVLRFVLEGYNALSWLCLDPKTHDRKSCLPVHIQKLLELYYTISALV